MFIWHLSSLAFISLHFISFSLHCSSGPYFMAFPSFAFLSFFSSCFLFPYFLKFPSFSFPFFFFPFHCFPSFDFLFPPSLSFCLLFFFAFFSSPLTELGQESVPSSTHNATVVVSAAGVMPYLQGRAGGGDQNSTHSISTTHSASSSSSSSSSTSCDRQPAPPGTMVSSHPQGQSYSVGISNSGLGPPPPNTPGGVYTSTGQHNASDGCSLANMVSPANTNIHTADSFPPFISASCVILCPF